MDVITDAVGIFFEEELVVRIQGVRRISSVFKDVVFCLKELVYEHDFPQIINTGLCTGVKDFHRDYHKRKRATDIKRPRSPSDNRLFWSSGGALRHNQRTL
jgi:hypothetical protein